MNRRRHAVITEEPGKATVVDRLLGDYIGKAERTDTGKWDSFDKRGAKLNLAPELRADAAARVWRNYEKSLIPQVCFHGREVCSFCGVGRMNATPAKRIEAAAKRTIPEAARERSVPTCAVCGKNKARRNLVGLYTKPCVPCVKAGFSAPGLGESA